MTDPAHAGTLQEVSEQFSNERASFTKNLDEFDLAYLPQNAVELAKPKATKSNVPKVKKINRTLIKKIKKFLKKKRRKRKILT